ncbi:hypothetical protein C8R41DRAFT_916108 [Lentinula lateritia]|uniref:Uncharacterized protein n=1 Tax=Lentinula lateritia TaxID=40482 RepID=A0ABQ8VQD5_9AGAR|nr:hypothetical protein C8R41DRAFT_916108 [Lentinula lateritia]
MSSKSNEPETSAPKRYHCYCSTYCGGPDGLGRLISYSSFRLHLQKSTVQNDMANERPWIRKRVSSKLSTTTLEAHKHVLRTPFHLPRPQFRKPSQLILPLDDTHEVPPTASEIGNSGDDEGLGPQDGVNVQDNEEPEDEDVVDPGSLFEQHLSDNAPSGSLSQQSVHRDDEENRFQYEDDTQSPNFVPNIDDIRISYKFINELRSAKLDSPIEPLDDTLLQQILDPPQHLLEVENPDECLSLELYLATTHTSEETYTNACVAVTRRFPDCRLLSYYMVKKLVEKLSGVSPIVRDMCVNSCIGYTGPYASIEDCPHCGETRYKIQGKKKIARKQFTTLPLAPQLQALWRTTEGAASMQYRQNCTKAAFEELEHNNGVKVSAYKDFFDGTTLSNEQGIASSTKRSLEDDQETGSPIKKRFNFVSPLSMQGTAKTADLNVKTYASPTDTLLHSTSTHPDTISLQTGFCSNTGNFNESSNMDDISQNGDHNSSSSPLHAEQLVLDPSSSTLTSSDTSTILPSATQSTNTAPVDAGPSANRGAPPVIPAGIDNVGTSIDVDRSVPIVAADVSPDGHGVPGVPVGGSGAMLNAETQSNESKKNSKAKTRTTSTGNSTVRPNTSTGMKNLCMIEFKNKHGVKATRQAFEEHWSVLDETELKEASAAPALVT